MALEMWNGSVWVTTTVGTSPMCAGQRRHPGRDQHRVQAPGHRRSVRRATADREAVLDGDEVEQAALGLGDEVGPVPGGEQLGRAGPRLAPRGGMPARAVEGDRQVHGCLRSARAGPRPGRRLGAPGRGGPGSIPL